MDIPESGLAEFVSNLSMQHQVLYVRTYADEWAESVTRLAGDDVEHLLVALKRAGVLSGHDMGQILINYLRELRASGG